MVHSWSLNLRQSLPLRQFGKLSWSRVSGCQAQAFGAPTDVLIRLAQDNAPKAGDDVSLGPMAGFEVELSRSEFVGSAVGDELREQGGLGLLLALGVDAFYVAFRFQFKFSVGAVVALIHDVLIVLGIFALLGLDFDLTVLAAVLAVIGYSLNDSIVVSDRIRENFGLCAPMILSRS